MRKMQLSTAGNLILVLIALAATAPASGSYGDGIQPYSANPYYWQYKSKPVLLIGASNNDNLWQWTGTQLTEHLDLMRSVGGNYVRNTMSDRDEGDLFAATRLDDGRYDLDRWNDAYWERLRFFFEETHKRDIIVQLTLWDWFDLSGAGVYGVYGGFAVHPLNPANNINWEPGTIKNARYFYGGALWHKNQPVLDYQHRYIDKSMSIALQYNHALFNINNESGLGAEWENYWAIYIKKAAERAGKKIHVTSMQYAPGTEKEAVERFWRNIFGGAASTRFHRPALRDGGRWGWGIGLSERAQQTLRAVEMFFDEFAIFNAEPYEAISTVGNSVDCYALADMGKAYAVYFPDGKATVHLDPWVYVRKVY